MTKRRPQAATPPWQVGDRMWVSHLGTGKVLRLRERVPSPPLALPPEALVEFALPTPHRQWMILANVERLAPQDQERLPDGLRSVVVGQAVWHSKFADGVVREVDAEHQPTAALIDFGERGVHTIAMGGGYLREKAPAVALEVRFGDCFDGWIGLKLSIGWDRLNLEFDNHGRFFADLLVWLEALTLGVHLCTVESLTDIGYRAFEAHGIGVDGVRLRVNESFHGAGSDVKGDSFFEARLPRRELVAKLYEGFRAFAQSADYLPEEWESAASGGMHDGTPLRELRNKRVERWLAETPL